MEDRIRTLSDRSSDSHTREGGDDSEEHGELHLEVS